MTDPLLSIRDLRTVFHTDEGLVRAADGVSFDVERGETVCLVGESGSGKTVTGESITRLVRTPPGEIVGGEIVFDGRDLTTLSDEALRDLRGGRIAHVFQNPQGALNPVYTVGWQIVEAIQLHQDLPREDARARGVDLLDRVGIPEATRRFDDYPHEFSGGMKQRVSLAMALATNPDLLIADEPTVGLDPEERVRLRSALSNTAAGRVVILSTHIVPDVEATANKIAILDDGRLLTHTDVENLVSQVAGDVYKCVVPRQELSALRDRYQICSTVQRSDGVEVRLIAETSPTDDATQVPPTLEDAYLETIDQRTGV
jgi:peptide/nickel transport system ATP-binding protein